MNKLKRILIVLLMGVIVSAIEIDFKIGSSSSSFQLGSLLQCSVLLFFDVLNF